MADTIDPGFEAFEVVAIQAEGMKPDFEEFTIERIEEGPPAQYRAFVEVRRESPDFRWWSERPIDRPFEAVVRLAPGHRYRVGLHIGLTSGGTRNTLSFEGSVEFYEQLDDES